MLLNWPYLMLLMLCNRKDVSAFKWKWSYFRYIQPCNLGLMQLMYHFLGTDRQSSLPSLVFPIHMGKLTHNCTTFLHSQGTLWVPPGVSISWCGIQRASLPLLMLEAMLKEISHFLSVQWAFILYTSYDITNLDFRKWQDRSGGRRVWLIYHFPSGLFLVTFGSLPRNISWGPSLSNLRCHIDHT